MIQKLKSNLVVHIKNQTCFNNPSHYDKKILLTLDNKTFICQMGCPGTMDLKTMEKHLVNEHTRDELWRWSINYDKMVAVIGNCTKTMKSSESESKIQYQCVNLEEAASLLDSIIDDSLDC